MNARGTVLAHARARGSLDADMASIDDLLAPARAQETLVRRAARGHRPAWRLLVEQVPRVIRAEARWLYPTLLRRAGGPVGRAWLLPASGEHEQILELIDRIGPQPPARFDPMFVAAQALLLVHLRAERDWIARVHRLVAPADDAPLARYVDACRPLVAGAATYDATGSGHRA